MQSYPVVESRWKIVLPISFFVCFFMIIFQPFGLSGYTGTDKYLVLGGYGLVTFLVLFFNLFIIPWLFPGFLKEEKWTVWKELIFLLWILFTIGLANLFYTSFFFNLRFSLTSILTVQLFTMAIGVIPITMLTIVKQNFLNRRNRITADQLSATISARKSIANGSSEIRLMSDNGKDEISLLISDLLAIDAEGNYITLYCRIDDKPQTILLRNTLLYAEEVLSPFPEIFKCHRSYLVNLNRVEKVTGNSQGYRLVVDGVQ